MMKKSCFIIMFLIISLKSWAQIQFERNVYLTLSLGGGLLHNQSIGTGNNYLTTRDALKLKIFSTFVAI